MEQRWYVRNRGRITGPFSLDQLKDLHKRGQFRRFCEVSADKTTWSSASTLHAVFAPGDVLQLAEEPVAAVAATGAPIGAGTDEWFYVNRQGQQQGPVPRRELVRLVQDRLIDFQTLVWSPGMPEWLTL